MAKNLDLFICHSSHDKATFVDQLVAALVATHGLRVWYDRFEIKPGDDIRAAIEEGIAAADFGAVVLSPHFWTTWTNDEVRYLQAHEDKTGDGRAVIVPVMLGMNPEGLKDRSPRLSERDAILGDQGAVIAAQALADHVRNVRPRPKAVSPTYNLPRRPVTNFVGRDAKLAEVITALTTGNVSISASIEGLAGIGKTELAVNVATQLSGTDHFPGGIYWLDAEHRDLSNVWGGVIADRLDIASGPVAERCRRTLNRLASMQPARLLVILDNVGSWADDVQPGPLPQGPHVAILATSRQLKLGGQAFTHVDLDVLDLAAARALLLGIAPARVSEEGLDALLTHLDGHALALELAGAYLARYPSTKATDYLRRLNAGDAVEDKVAKDVRYQRTVKAALEATVAMLDEAGRMALLICGQFADVDASVALLRACGVDEDLERALRDLHLIRSDGERWGMHRLVRGHARRLGEAAGAAAATFVTGCVDFSVRLTGMWGFAAYRDEWPHLAQAIDTCERYREGDERQSYSEALALLLTRASQGAQGQGDLQRAKALATRALEIDLSHLPDPAAALPVRHNALAGVLSDLGEWEAARHHYEESLRMEGGIEAAEGATADIRRQNLAVVYRHLGDLAGAKRLFERALADTVARRGDGHPDVGIRKGNLGSLLAEMGRLDEAEVLLRDALQGAVVRDAKSPEVATRMANLAEVLVKRGDLGAARDFIGRSIAIDAANFGPSHHHVANGYQSLGVLCLMEGDASAAETYLRKALDCIVSSGEKGVGHPETLIIRSNLAAALGKQGRRDEAREELVAVERAVKLLPAKARIRVRVEAVCSEVRRMLRLK